MSRIALVAFPALWLGATLVLDRIRWVRRPSPATRLRPYLSGSRATPSSGSAALTDLLTATARDLATSGARLAGVTEDAERRLRRIHATVDVTGFRLRQLGWTLAGLAGGAGVAAVLRPPAPVLSLLLLGTPMLAFLVVEQHLANESSRWQQRLRLELPVVAEQLGMLLSAGYSLTAAIDRVATRGSGACARDLRRVASRIRHGVGEIDALREWAELADVDVLDRLVAVLALNREAGDLGALVTEEARSCRGDLHRRFVEIVERRGQQVWIPVTVATLIPGVLFLAIPFIEALRLFSPT